MGLPRMNHACLVNFLLQTIFALSFGGFPVFVFIFETLLWLPVKLTMIREREQFIVTKRELPINWRNKKTVSQREAPQVTPSPELNSQNSGRTSASRVGDCR